MPAQTSLTAWPTALELEYIFPKNVPEVRIALSTFDKKANRLPEAMWLSFAPAAPDGKGWQMEKIGQPVSPLNVMAHGGRHLHAVTRHVGYADAQGIFLLETMDAPWVAPGQRKLTNFDDSTPNMQEGVHVNLFNNLWNTAFMQWNDDAVRYRFVVSFPQDHSALWFS